jgi:hypothetical protein
MLHKPFVLFVEVFYDGREPFWFGWKTYNTEDAAIQAFKNIYSNRNPIVGPVARIVNDGHTSIISV